MVKIMSKVYVVQEVNRVLKNPDGSVANIIPAFNYGPAEAYGEVRYLMQHGNTRFGPTDTVRMLRNALEEFTAEDYLLPTGDPATIGVAFALAAKRTGGMVRTLKWMKQDRCYLELTYNINA